MITETVFGPVQSRRFGTSLGVDLSPNLKQCNFDCLYCELKKEKKRVELQTNPIIVEKIFSEIEYSLRKFSDIKVLTFTANGEPTLYPDLEKLIDKVNKIKHIYQVKTLILSNSGNIWFPDIQRTLMKFDNVKLSLDCITDDCFQKIDRPLKGISIDGIKTGILEFSEKFKGELYIETLFLENINSGIDEVEKLNQFLLKLPKVERIDIGTVERPPAYDVKPLPYSVIFDISKQFDKSLPILITKNREKSSTKNHLLKGEILHTLNLRPLTKYDFVSLFDEETQENLQSLIDEELIKIVKVGNAEFYKLTTDLS
jgi:wyosine [tRNA(Phe)-imidazoG37] synthetase (radical SAM superfamily)